MEDLTMKAYSIDLRERVLADCDTEMGTRAVATKYRVSESWVRRLKQQRRETGQIAARRGGPSRPRILVDQYEQLQRLVEEKPDATLEELRQRLGTNASIATLWRALRTLRLTFKKKSSTRPNKTVPMCKSGVPLGKPK